MIISHRYQFIFIKTKKTAGTSIEVFLSTLCGEEDIVTPIFPHVAPHVSRNYSGLWNPIPELIHNRGKRVKSLMRSVVNRKRFYNHISAQKVQKRISGKVWNSYYKFCVDRNPWDKVLSHYHMLNEREGNSLTLDNYLQRGSLNYCFNYPLYTNEAGDLILDKVIKYESLNEGLSEIFSQLGIPFNGILSVKAKSSHRKTRRHYYDVLTLKQREIIDRIFEKEIAMNCYQY